MSNSLSQNKVSQKLMTDRMSWSLHCTEQEAPAEKWIYNIYIL